MLLPELSSGGAKVPMPPLPGATVMMPPPTPLLAGSPTSNSHSPDELYIPEMIITANTCWQ